ncbi:MAG: BON domain-containing protein [Candidatus Tectimicrobiota bacterium]
MKTRSYGRLVLFAALLLAVLIGCTTTQNPGRQLDDNAIHAAVKTKLTADRLSNLVNVDVNVSNGVVTLAGVVPNAAVKAEAEQEARSVSGVSRVINNLQVNPGSRGHDEPDEFFQQDAQLCSAPPLRYDVVIRRLQRGGAA